MKRLLLWHPRGNHFSHIGFVTALAIVAGTVAFVCYAQQTSQTPSAALQGGGVVGNIYAKLQVLLQPGTAGVAVNRYIPLPDFEVFLQNTDTGEVSQPAKTNLFGRYAFPKQKAGTYQLRWKQQAGWREGVLARQIVISNGTASASLVEITPQAGFGLLVGQVNRADGRSTWVYNEFFGVNETPLVEALDGSGSKVAGPVRVNSAGQFAIAGLPRTALQLQAKIEAAVATQSVPEEAFSFGGSVSPVTITFNERSPQILSVATKVDQKVVRNVPGGATVTVDVDAVSPDQRALTFVWRQQEGMGTLNAEGASASWTLPTAPGSYSGYVMVSDGFGGYAVSSFGVLAGPSAAASATPSVQGLVQPQNTATTGAPSSASSGSTTCLSVILDDTALNGNPYVGSLVGSTIKATLGGTTVGTTATIVPGQHLVQLTGLPVNTDLVLTVSYNGAPSPGFIFESAPRSPLPEISPLSNQYVVQTGSVPGDCQTVKLTQYPFPASVATSFLSYLSAMPGDATTAASYYALVDPQGNRTGVGKTLGDWWQFNGFDSNGNAAGEIRTSYLNNNDLGSGRDMHFLQHADGTVAAYVTNYVDIVNGQGDFNQNPTYADSAAAQDTARQAATVCMEWSPVGNSTNIVKFFIYNGANASALNTTSADLDGGGLKFVPQLCLACHGGDFTAGSPNCNASFREFDLATFKFPGGRDVPNEVEREAFKQQNLIVGGNASDNISTSAIKNLVNGWYGIGQPFTGQNTRWNPPGWDDTTSNPPLTSRQSPNYLYHNVVAKSCRTCHVAFTNNLYQGITGTGIDWTSYQQFQANALPLLSSFVFPSTSNVAPAPSMPHALVTYKNFWSSRNPSESEIFTNFTGP